MKTLEELENMPISLLRGVDIQSPEEEQMVQRVINSRMSEMPIAVDFGVPSYRTDNLTPETEALLQAEIDTKKSVMKDKISLEEKTEEDKIVKMSETVKETLNKTFCQFCDSKGVRHKKNCTRPQ